MEDLKHVWENTRAVVINTRYDHNAGLTEAKNKTEQLFLTFGKTDTKLYFRT